MVRERIKILAIDDISDNLLTLQAIIGETFENAIFFTALSGIKGIELAKSINPDVILLDILMPVMDGYQVCEILKKDDMLKDIPVVFITANKDDRESRIQALNIGAEAFLSKPIDESELIAQIRAMYKVRKANLQKVGESKRLETLVADKTIELNKTISILKKEKDLAQKYLKDLRLAGNTFENSIKNAPIPIMIHAEDGTVLNISQNWTTLTHYEKSDIPTIFDWIKKAYGKNKDEVSNLMKKFYNLIEIQYDGEYDIITKDKRKLTWNFNSSYIGKLPDGRVVVMSVARDVTEFNRANKKLKESEKQYRLLTNLMPLGMGQYQVIHDTHKKTINFKILGVNKIYEQLVGKKSSELVGKNLREVFPKMEQYWMDIFEEVAIFGDTKIFEGYSSTIDSYLKIIVYKIETDKMAIVIEDVTEDRKKQREIMYMSYHDSLTGLHNRRYYEDNLIKLDIPKNYPLTVVMSDINGLKLINDAFGHRAGDKLLISAANIISNSCRETDLVARIGGDEFIIVMPNTSGQEADKVIEKINEEAKKVKVESMKLSISFGFDTKNEISKDISEIYRSAEDLMYREKLLVIPSMRSGAIETILNTLNEKDESSEIHSRTVSNISEKIALAYGMDRLEVNEVKTAGLLHDIGKIIIPIEIITKEGKLTAEEYDLIKGHPEIGFRILNSTHDMRNIANIVLNHHERWDGLGYPRGIKTDEIPLQSRIIAIADAFDAMTSKRSYREVCTNREALDEIIRCSGTQFDPKLSQIFTDNFNTIIEVI